jgi:hypothetical protein
LDKRRGLWSARISRGYRVLGYRTADNFFHLAITITTLGVFAAARERVPATR